MWTKGTFLICAVLVLLQGCSGDQQYHNETHINTTLGQEIIDLEKAKESGAIDEDRFEELVERIIAART